MLRDAPWRAFDIILPISREKWPAGRHMKYIITTDIVVKSGPDTWESFFWGLSDDRRDGRKHV